MFSRGDYVEHEEYGFGIVFDSYGDTITVGITGGDPSHINYYMEVLPKELKPVTFAYKPDGTTDYIVDGEVKYTIPFNPYKSEVT